MLDTPTEEAFDRLTRLAARILDTPVALVSLVDEDRQFFKSCVGLPMPWALQRETSLSHSFCQHAVTSGEPLVIEDAREHPLVRDNLAIPDLGVVAYAGIPLITPDGHPLGSFCVIDAKPRAWTAQEIDILKDLAASVMTEIELRAVAREAERGRREKAALLESAGDGIYGVDLEGRCTFINGSGAQMLGYPPDEILGKDMHQLVHHHDSDGAPSPVDECPIFRSFRVGESVRRDDEVLWRQDGTAFPVEYSSCPNLEEGRVTGAVVAFRDITERRALERMQREFIAMVTHELRNPVTSIMGFAELMQRRGLIEQAVDTIAAEARRLDRLIGDLLDVTRLEVGRLELRRTSVDLVELAQATAEQAQALTELHAVRVEVAGEPRPGWWDRDRLGQVLRNLLSNAVKYSPEGGEIRIRVEHLDGEARVSVVDAGVGIAPEALPRLFDRFYRTDQALASGVEGLGLGLYITRSLVEAHGGRLWAESALGAGSTFTISLPYSHRVEG